MNTELYRPWFAHYEDFVPRTVEIWDKPLYSLLDEAAGSAAVCRPAAKAGYSSPSRRSFPS